MLPMRAAMRFLALNLFAATMLAGATAQAGTFSCRETPIVQPVASLSVLSARVAQGPSLTILAIGSSSTEGIGASAKDKTYPARLKALLGKAWPNLPIEIVNAGIGGETAPQTLTRLKTALSARRYDLVIWQVGTNDAVNGGDLDAFKTMVGDGIAMVKQAGVSLAILDPQFFPGVREPERYRDFVAAIANTARGQNVPVFTRYDAMREWYRNDAQAFTSALSSDGFHMSDAGYVCLARDMATALVGMAAPSRAVMAQTR
jgi:lysophospholipase L1-like esterase